MSNRQISYDGSNYTVSALTFTTNPRKLEFSVQQTGFSSSRVNKTGFSLQVRRRSYAFPTATQGSGRQARWNNAAHPGWANNERVTVRLVGPTTGSRNEEPTATFVDRPENHDGSTPFKLSPRFSGTPGGLRPKRDAASVLEVIGGSVTKARETASGANLMWEVTIARHRRRHPARRPGRRAGRQSGERRPLRAPRLGDAAARGGSANDHGRRPCAQKRVPPLDSR